MVYPPLFEQAGWLKIGILVRKAGIYPGINGRVLQLIIVSLSNLPIPVNQKYTRREWQVLHDQVQYLRAHRLKYFTAPYGAWQGR